MSLKHIFAEPQVVEGFNKNYPISIFPVRMENYDEFFEMSKFLYISKDNFAKTDLSLFRLILLGYENLEPTLEKLLDKMIRVFEIVTKKSVGFVNEKDMFGFLMDDGNMIADHNYDMIRKIIMEQNLMFEPKQYKNKLVQEWADRAMQSRQKKSSGITLEDMITTVKSYQGITYEQIKKQSVYQLYADFYRASKMIQFEQSSLFATVSDKVKIEYFAQGINLFMECNPYNDLFVDSSKLNKLNQIAK